jgi:hypothetical protein
MSALIIGATWARIGREFAEPPTLCRGRPDIGWARKCSRLQTWSGKVAASTPSQQRQTHQTPPQPRRTGISIAGPLRITMVRLATDISPTSNAASAKEKPKQTHPMPEALHRPRDLHRATASRDRLTVGASAMFARCPAIIALPRLEKAIFGLRSSLAPDALEGSFGGRPRVC